VLRSSESINLALLPEGERIGLRVRRIRPVHLSMTPGSHAQFAGCRKVSLQPEPSIEANGTAVSRSLHRSDLSIERHRFVSPYSSRKALD